jgi:hypothetical protein
MLIGPVHFDLIKLWKLDIEICSAERVDLLNSAANALGAEVKPAKRCLKGDSPYKFREILHTE